MNAVDDKELADRVVVLGVGNNTHDLYAFGAYHVIGCTFEDFVRDWRVAGALMEKCLENSKQDYDINVERDITNDHYLVSIRGYTVDATNYSNNDNCARTIIEACTEALEANK